MSTDPSTKRIVTQVVKEFVEEGKMFTAFEVSLEVKQRGIRQRHRQLRDTVHEVIFQIGGPEDYTRTLRDVGAPEPAWVYHRPDDNPYSYQPLPHHDAPPKPAKNTAPDIPLVVPVGVRQPMKLQSCAGSPASIPPGAYGADQRGRVCIPVTMLAKLGVGPGERVQVTCSPAESKVHLRRPLPNDHSDSDTSYTVEADGNIRITQSTLEKAGIERLQCYHIEGDASSITVSEYK